jgi:hypothetical protein
MNKFNKKKTESAKLIYLLFGFRINMEAYIQKNKTNKLMTKLHLHLLTFLFSIGVSCYKHYCV